MIMQQRQVQKRRRFAHGGAAIALLLLSLLAPGRPAQADSLVSVLSYNVHGLSPLLAGDDPRRRIEKIGARAATYDVALFQEDFEYHGIIRRRLQGSVGAAGNGVILDPPRLAASILLTPVALLLPHFSPPYGAGLSTFVKAALARPDDADREAFGVCAGWLGARFDCWASKGYLRIGVRTADGTIVDVYNTHLDAGRGGASLRARRHQLGVLASAIERESGDRAIIVGGDFNLVFDRPGDGDLMAEFRQRLDLRDSGAGPGLPRWRQHDYLLYRSGGQAEISVEQAGEALEFVVDGHRALSDHPAIYGRFRVRPIPDGASEHAGQCRSITIDAPPPRHAGSCPA
jgi:hypothetical protein